METATKAPDHCLNLCQFPLIKSDGNFRKRYFYNRCSVLLLLKIIWWSEMYSLFSGSFSLCLKCEYAITRPSCISALTSKQYSCPRMLEWTGLMMASSSRVRSSASAALLGDSRDSWEWDSLKLCIKRVLGKRKTGRGGDHFITVYHKNPFMSPSIC